MAQRKAFPLRINQRIYDALERWAAAELRSVNGQIEFLLREALTRAGRVGKNDEMGQKGASGQTKEG